MIIILQLNRYIMRHIALLFILLINTALVSSKDLLVYEPQTIDERVPTNAHYQCLRQSQEQIGLRVRVFEQGIPQYYVQMFNNAKNAGLKIEIIVDPDVRISNQQHVANIIKLFGKAVSRIWVYPLYLLDSTENNCRDFMDLLSTLKKRGYKTGAYTNRSFWKLAFDEETGCPTVSSELLAWLPMSNQMNNKPDFEPYKQIGGWTKPYMKFYEKRDICGIGYKAFYYE